MQSHCWCHSPRGPQTGPTQARDAPVALPAWEGCIDMAPSMENLVQSGWVRGQRQTSCFSKLLAIALVLWGYSQPLRLALQSGDQTHERGSKRTEGALPAFPGPP